MNCYNIDDVKRDLLEWDFTEKEIAKSKRVKEPSCGISKRITSAEETGQVAQYMRVMTKSATSPTMDAIGRREANTTRGQKHEKGNHPRTRKMGERRMTIKELREAANMSRQQFMEYFGLKYRTLQDWELGNRECPTYLTDLMEYKLRNEKIIK